MTDPTRGAQKTTGKGNPHNDIHTVTEFVRNWAAGKGKRKVLGNWRVLPVLQGGGTILTYTSKNGEFETVALLSPKKGLFVNRLAVLAGQRSYYGHRYTPTDLATKYRTSLLGQTGEPTADKAQACLVSLGFIPNRLHRHLKVEEARKETFIATRQGQEGQEETEKRIGLVTKELSVSLLSAPSPNSLGHGVGETGDDEGFYLLTDIDRSTLPEGEFTRVDYLLRSTTPIRSVEEARGHLVPQKVAEAIMEGRNVKFLKDVFLVPIQDFTPEEVDKETANKALYTPNLEMFGLLAEAAEKYRQEITAHNDAVQRVRNMFPQTLPRIEGDRLIIKEARIKDSRAQGNTVYVRGYVSAQHAGYEEKINLGDVWHQVHQVNARKATRRRIGI